MILTPHHVEKPWGVTDLPDWVGGTDGRRIGEIWYEGTDGGALPLLIKYIFTSEKLSVQVHPADAEARRRDLPRGKDEGWFIVSAEPGATLGIGTREPLSAPALRAAAEDGSIEKLLQWHAVSPGDYYYVPAGTVHAIGPGVGLIEVQPNVDITYRLYDYGRPRELHLDDAVAVAEAGPYDLANRAVAGQAAGRLPAGKSFALTRHKGPVAAGFAEAGRTLICIPLDGTVLVEGENVDVGQCALASRADAIDVPADTTVLIAEAL